MSRIRRRARPSHRPLMSGVDSPSVIALREGARKQFFRRLDLDVARLAIVKVDMQVATAVFFSVPKTMAQG